MLSWLFTSEPQWARDIHDHIRVVEQRLKERIMSASQDTVDALTAQLLKSKTEILGKIADLEAAVAAGETPDFTELKAAVQGQDDIVADVVVEPTPAPVVTEPEVDPTV